MWALEGPYLLMLLFTIITVQLFTGVTSNIYIFISLLQKVATANGEVCTLS